MSQSTLAQLLCAEVSAEFRERNVMSCVFGSRLLLGLLRDAGIEAVAVGVLLTVSDPVASSGGPGRCVIIGDFDNAQALKDRQGPISRIGVPDGFAGHVVVLAKVEGRVVLLDPTVFQAARFWRGAGVTPPATSIVLGLGGQTELSLDDAALAVHERWTYEYSPEPHLDWSTRSEWVGFDRFRVDDVLRRRLAKKGINLTRPAVPGRNDPCPCGSGVKFKRCCRTNGSATGCAGPVAAT